MLPDVLLPLVFLPPSLAPPAFVLRAPDPVGRARVAGQGAGAARARAPSHGARASSRSRPTWASATPPRTPAAARPRASAIMFGPPGFLYVYLIYGMHHCMNFVTETDGVAGAVLDPCRGAPRGLRVRRSKRRSPGARTADGAREAVRRAGVTVANKGLDVTRAEELFVADDGAPRPRAAHLPAHRRRLRGRVGRPPAALLRRAQPLRQRRPLDGRAPRARSP